MRKHQVDMSGTPLNQGHSGESGRSSVALRHVILTGFAGTWKLFFSRFTGVSCARKTFNVSTSDGGVYKNAWSQ